MTVLTPFSQPGNDRDITLRSRVANEYAAALTREVQVAGDFLLAGKRLRIEAAGSLLFGVVTAALDHLKYSNTSGHPDLIIRVWEAGDSMGHDSWSGDAMPEGRTADFRLEAESTALAGWMNPNCGTLYLHDPASQVAWCALKDLQSWPSWERAAPFRALLAAWLGRHGGCFAHASCVGKDGRALLLAGPGGSGKSTTALLCAEQGWDYYADDYSLLELKGGEVLAHPFYNTAKLTSSSLGFFAGWKPHHQGSDEDGEKSIMSVHGRRPSALQGGVAKVGMLLFPTAEGALEREHVELEPISPGEALRLLIPSSLLQVPTCGPSSFARLAALVRQLPSMRLRLSYRAHEVVAGLSTCLEKIP
jgi:hypothetical protein